MFTYDPKLLTSLSRVRFLIGDTNESDPQLDDYEIAYLLTQYASDSAAAAAAARGIAAKYARRVTEAVGDLKISNSELQSHYAAIATNLGSSGATSGVPTAGGVYQADKDAAASNDSLVQPAFTIGMHDFGGA
jgi:hypothetical protein